jgi:hypothetical protein
MYIYQYISGSAVSEFGIYSFSTYQMHEGGQTSVTPEPSKCSNYHTKTSHHHLIKNYLHFSSDKYHKNTKSGSLEYSFIYQNMADLPRINDREGDYYFLYIPFQLVSTQKNVLEAFCLTLYNTFSTLFLTQEVEQSLFAKVDTLFFTNTFLKVRNTYQVVTFLSFSLPLCFVHYQCKQKKWEKMLEKTGLKNMYCLKFNTS